MHDTINGAMFKEMLLFGTVSIAAGETESYMVLNRIYNIDSSTGQITNPSTYISPRDYTYIFATNTDTNRDFWVQIGKKIIARRVMSAAQIPLM